jgi:hypothetical protein
MRAGDKMMNELLPGRESVGGDYFAWRVAESDTVGKKCCAPHYSSGLIPAEIIYVPARAVLPQITPRFALAVRKH